MSETSINPPTSSTFGFMNQYSASKSKVNTVRVTAVAERLSAYFEAEAASSTSQVPKSMEYFNLLLSLARSVIELWILFQSAIVCAVSATSYSFHAISGNYHDLECECNSIDCMYSSALHFFSFVNCSN